MRHRAYVRALEAKGVDCIMGNFAKRDRIYKGKGYKAQWRRYEEKQTDVGIGVHLINDAHLGRFDRAFMLSLDTDMLPVLKLMKSERPHQPRDRICSAPASGTPSGYSGAGQRGRIRSRFLKLNALYFGPTVSKHWVHRCAAASRIQAPILILELETLPLHAPA